jgi:CBS domain containing-hemolysin-like protein
MDVSLQNTLNLLLVGFLVFLNGFFVAAEFAIVKIRETQLEPMVNKGHRRAKIACRLLSNLDAALSATQLGITLASLGLGWVGEPVFARMLHPILESMHIREEVQHKLSFVIGFSAITFLHIVLGELAPKSLAIQKPLPVTLWVAQPLDWFYRISYPAIWALNQTAMFMLRRVGIQPASEADMIHSQEELRLLISAAQKHSGGTTLGRDVVLNAFDLSRREAREVMRPRGEIVGLDTEASMNECLDIAEKTRYSRFPLCESGDLDKTLGVVHFKDLFAMRMRARRGADLRSVVRRIVYVPPSCRLERLLQILLDRKVHLAIVVDEYGGTLGLVTLENILEELVGQIQDEFDQEKPLVEQDGDAWKLDGTLPLHELAALVGETFDEEEDLATTSGFVTHRLGGFPKEGDTLAIGNFILRVEEMSGPKVARLNLRRTPQVQTSSEAVDTSAEKK